jgi:hypothetical protein
MTEYWVFQDKSFKRACIHRSNCSVRQGALNPGRSEGTWHGAFPTYEEARRKAAEMCAKTRPGQHQRVLPLSAGALLPLSQNSARDPQTVMKLAVEPDAVEEATIYLPGL